MAYNLPLSSDDAKLLEAVFLFSVHHSLSDVWIVRLTAVLLNADILRIKTNASSKCKCSLNKKIFPSLKILLLSREGSLSRNIFKPVFGHKSEVIQTGLLQLPDG
jgi:hypothetical protein